MPLNKKIKELRAQEASQEISTQIEAKKSGFDSLVLSAAVENKMEAFAEYFAPLWKGLEKGSHPLAEDTKWIMLIADITGARGGGWGGAWFTNLTASKTKALRMFMEEGVGKLEGFVSQMQDPKEAEKIKGIMSEASDILMRVNQKNDKELAIPLAGFGLGLGTREFEGKRTQTLIVRPLKEIELSISTRAVGASELGTKGKLLSLVEEKAKLIAKGASVESVAKSEQEKELVEFFVENLGVKETLEKEPFAKSVLIGSGLDSSRPSIRTGDQLPDFTMTPEQVSRVEDDLLKARNTFYKNPSNTAPLYQDIELDASRATQAGGGLNKAQSIEQKWVVNTLNFWRQQVLRSSGYKGFIALPKQERNYYKSHSGSWWQATLSEGKTVSTELSEITITAGGKESDINTSNHRSESLFTSAVKSIGINSEKTPYSTGKLAEDAKIIFTQSGGGKAAKKEVSFKSKAGQDTKALGWLTGIAKIFSTQGWSKAESISWQEADPRGQEEIAACKEDLLALKKLSDRWNKGFEAIEKVLLKESLAFTGVQVNEWLKKWNLDTPYEHAKSAGLLSTDAISWGLGQGEGLKDRAQVKGPLFDLAKECGYALGLNFNGNKTLEEQFTDQLKEMGLSERGIKFLGRSQVMQSFVKEQFRTFKVKRSEGKKNATLYITFALDIAEAWESVMSPQTDPVEAASVSQALISQGKERAKKAGGQTLSFERQEELIKNLLNQMCEYNTAFEHASDGIGRKLGVQQVANGKKAEVFGELIKGKEAHYKSFLKSWVEDIFEVEGQFAHEGAGKVNERLTARWKAIKERVCTDFSSQSRDDKGLLLGHESGRIGSINWPSKPFNHLALWEVLSMPSVRMISLSETADELAKVAALEAAKNGVVVAANPDDEEEDEEENESKVESKIDIQEHMRTVKEIGERDPMLKHPIVAKALNSGVLDASDGLDIMAQMRSLCIDKYALAPAIWKSIVKDEEFAKTLIESLQIGKKPQTYWGHVRGDMTYATSNLQRIYVPRFDIKAQVARRLETSAGESALPALPVVLATTEQMEKSPVSASPEEVAAVRLAVEAEVKNIADSMHLSKKQVAVLSGAIYSASGEASEEEGVSKTDAQMYSGLLNNYIGRGLDSRTLTGLLKFHSDSTIKSEHSMLFTENLPELTTNNWQECELVQKESGYKKIMAERIRQDVVDLYQKALAAHGKAHPEASLELKHEAAFVGTRDKLQNLVDYMKHLDPGVYEQNHTLGLAGWLRSSDEWHSAEQARIADEAARESEKYSKSAQEAKNLFEKQTSAAWFPIVGIHHRDGWVAKELITVGDMIAEGKAMSHCVSSYAPNCREGQSRVFSITLMDAPVATLEIAPMNEQGKRITWQEGNSSTTVKIVQNKGRYNASITSPAALEFCKEVEEKVAVNYAALYAKKIAEEEAKRRAQIEARKRREQEAKGGAVSLSLLEGEPSDTAPAIETEEKKPRARRARVN